MSRQRPSVPTGESRPTARGDLPRTLARPWPRAHTRQRRGPDVRWPWLALAAALGAGNHAAAQRADRYRQVEETAPFRLHVNEASLGAYAEGTFETSQLGGGSAVHYERIFVGPLLGLDLSGSVYHSRLFKYHFNGEGAFGWGYQDIRSGTLEHREQIEYLGLLSFSGLFLEEKPYATTLFADYDHTYRDYDFFSRVTVDSWRYGLNTGYADGPVPVSLSYYHRDEDVTDSSTPSSTREDVLTFIARNDRQRGNSTFNYTFNQFARGDFSGGEGVNHTLTLGDNERFGSRGQFDLNTFAGYNYNDNPDQNSDDFNAGLDLRIEHRDDLKSRYNFNYDRFHTGEFLSQSYLGHGELEHQLYDSLTSTLIGEGSYYSFDDPNATSETTRVGGGFSEAYSKRLGEHSKLNADNTLMLTYSDVQNSGGIQSVFDEAHSITGLGAGRTDSFFLNRPRVIASTIVITGTLDDPNGPFTRYEPALGDYRLEPSGELTRIVVLSARMRAARNYLVDYQSVASPSGHYNTLSEAFNIRFSLWNDLWGLYGRLQLILNDAPDDMLVEDLHSYTMGTDVQYRNFRAGAEYEIYDSNFSDYRTFRLYQSFSCQPDTLSTFGLNFTESWTDYLDDDRSEERYTAILRYHRRLAWRLSADLEGGVALRRGEGFDQTLATCRPGLEYRYGKSSIKAGYSYEYELFLDSEERHKHMFFVRAKRVF